MEEIVNQGTGVEGAVEAGQQMEDETQAQTGEDQAEAGSGEGERRQESKKSGEIAWARRIAAERQKLEGQFKVSPIYRAIERDAKRHNMSPEEYAETWYRQQEERENQEFQKRYNMTPEEFQGMVDKHPVVQQARQYLNQSEFRSAIESDRARFWQRFPDVTMDQVPKEVWALMDQAAAQGQRISLLHAYLEVMHDQTVSQAKNQGEQEAIRKLQRNAQTTPGSLGGGGADTGVTSISKMTQKDFDALVESVLRGERKQI
ncbi:MAG: hypothetical protein HPY50_04755 [Firmicutes bacterium]|nr:hypothetical protein [Bacillota bacterium]